MKVMEHDRTDDNYNDHQKHIDFVVSLHGGTLLCLIITMILILMLAECHVVYFGCFWLIVWLVLFLLFITSTSLRSLYPGNWIMALIINTSGGCTVGVLLVTNVGDGPILWTAAYSCGALIFMVIMGAWVPCHIKPHIYLFIIFSVLIFGSILSISLVYFLAYPNFLKVTIYCLVFLWTFPFVVFQSQQLHGYGPQGYPYDDLALGIVFFITDYLIIFTGFYWSIIFANILEEYKIHFK